jgi:hypothetical protein
MGLTVAPTVLWFGIASSFAGVSGSCASLAMNTQAVNIQTRLGRSFLPRAQALASLGTVSAALVSALLAPYVTPFQTALGGAFISLGILRVQGRKLLSAATEHVGDSDEPRDVSRVPIAPRTLGFLSALALAQGLAIVAEISVGDWSSVLLKQDFEIPSGPNGYGFASFVLVQLLTRLHAPRMIDRLGMARMLRILGAGGATGYMAALLAAGLVGAAHSWAALALVCIGYGFLGAAVALIPAAYTSVGGSIPGIPASRALTTVGVLTAVSIAVGRLGFAQVAQWIPLHQALVLMGIPVLASVALRFLLAPERARSHSVQSASDA